MEFGFFVGSPGSGAGYRELGCWVLVTGPALRNSVLLCKILGYSFSAEKLDSGNSK